MRSIVKGCLIAVSALCAAPAFGGYDSNLAGEVSWVKIFTESDYIIFRLTTQPTSHPQCSPDYFVIPASMPESRRNQALAILLAAKHSGGAVSVGYDGTGNCLLDHIIVHAVSSV